MALETIASLSIASWLLSYLMWLAIWIPLVALLEYGAHRWVMHIANRVLDPTLHQLRCHATHHKGHNEHEFVDMPLRNCLLLTSPAFILIGAWGLLVGPFTSVIMPAAALFTWNVFYTWLWTRMHRAIHGVERNWFQHFGPVFRFFRDHHLRHHSNARVNFGTVFPWTDYLFFTWKDRRPSRPRKSTRLPAEPEAASAEQVSAKEADA